MHTLTTQPTSHIVKYAYPHAYSTQPTQRTSHTVSMYTTQSSCTVKYAYPYAYSTQPTQHASHSVEYAYRIRLRSPTDTLEYAYLSAYYLPNLHTPPTVKYTYPYTYPYASSHMHTDRATPFTAYTYLYVYTYLT
ncbi:hypothetical protein BDN72DRAFT_536505 [Pluteus cervinus]|uniref:Uncharacterized protein n=1 Tax=Pluteus cervinus TaxID=181527 RepID=A0ACD3AWY2_9AGAR|nr:hypothetical protein BDN72DRAFT_536505 [Pluteus cervinus]